MEIKEKKMQVCVTVIKLAGGMEQYFMEMPAGGYVPKVGDELTINGSFCDVTERWFKVVSDKDDNTQCSYGWDITAKQK